MRIFVALKLWQQHAEYWLDEILCLVFILAKKMIYFLVSELKDVAVIP